MNYFMWPSIFLMPRTLINSFETLLFTTALFYWKLYTNKKQQYILSYLRMTTDFKHSKHQLISRALVMINFAARPTSILPWVFIWPSYVFFNKRSFKEIT